MQSVFEKAIQDRKLRKGRQRSRFQDVLDSFSTDATQKSARLVAATKYTSRLGFLDSSASILANGVPLKRDDSWLQLLSNQIGMDLRIVQQAVFQRKVDDDAYVPDLFLADALPARNPVIMPESDSDLSMIDLNEVSGLQDGLVGLVPGVSVAESTSKSELIHLVMVADFDHQTGPSWFMRAVDLVKDHDNVELYIVHNPKDNAPGKLSRRIQQILTTESDDSTFDRLWQEANHVDGKGAFDPATGAADDVAPVSFWASAKPLLDAAGFTPGQAGVILNGRVVGPMNHDASNMRLSQDDLEMLLDYECKRRLTPAAKVLETINAKDMIQTTFAFAKLSNLLALSTASQVAESIFEGPPTARTSALEDFDGEHSAITAGDKQTASIQVVATIDPTSEQAQTLLPVLKVLSELHGVHTRIFLNPREQLTELPVKRFYRQVLRSAPEFDEAGALLQAKAVFQDLPESALLTLAMDVPPAWLVSPRDSVYDLDNLKLSTVKSGDVEATYQLDYILIEGHSSDVQRNQAPRGAQLVLSTDSNPHFADTIIMANLGYFQFKTNPGYYQLALQKGRSDEIFSIHSTAPGGNSKTRATDSPTDIVLTSFRGTTLFPKLSRKPGKEEDDVLQPSASGVDKLVDKAGGVLSSIGLDSAGSWLSKASKAGGSLLGRSDKSKDVQVLPHADINIFSVASGHLYERMLNIMMVSVMKHTSHSVKFWFIEQFLSPSFKAFLPIIAEEYGFRYEMVTYKWPHWLRAQREKQREIWGYKILFLDVLFPLDLDKVIFVDADQIVRTNMFELVQHDLEGAPYGFTPMCDSRVEMEGFRFWKQGYWRNFLRGLPYHISALYVVDLKKFRQMAAGDRLRGQYHQLSADPNSLSNLDQDLPNHMQHNLPIHSLPQEWLWCETWCSDASLAEARTIDLCNNPQTKEPKLDRARRQVPEWTMYDDEIAALAKRKVSTHGDSAALIAGSVRDSDAQAQEQAEEAEQHRQRQSSEAATALTPKESRAVKEEL